jgi:cytochrome c
MGFLFWPAGATSVYAVDGSAIYRIRCAMCHDERAKGANAEPKSRRA